MLGTIIDTCGKVLESNNRTKEFQYILLHHLQLNFYRDWNTQGACVKYS